MNFGSKVLFFCFLVGTALGEGSPQARLLPTQKEKLTMPPVLFEVDRQDAILASLKITQPVKSLPKLLPNRVYLYFLESENRWIWILTDFEGKIPEPLEGIRSSTVFPGKYLGAKNPQQKYLLNVEKAVWVPSFQSEQHYFWIYPTETNPSRIRIVTFVTPKGSMK